MGAEAIDLVRFVIAVEGSRQPEFLSGETVGLMVSPPAAETWLDASSYYGMGWSVEPTRRGANWWHSGSLEGAFSLVVRNDDGLAWAALFTSRPKDGDRFLEELNAELWNASFQAEKWPDHDLFELYGPAGSGGS